MLHSSRETARLLFSIAVEQGGYFTAKQAKEAGYGYPHLDYHVNAGNFERVEHGLYRMMDLPRGEHDELVRLSFWGRNRQDEPQAVVSHESALILHDLSELLPGEIHLTVPPTFRKKTPAGCVVHKGKLAPTDIEDHAGFRITTALRTLLASAANHTPQEQLEKAISQALARGLVRKTRLIQAAKENPRSRRLARILENLAPTAKTKGKTG